MLITKPPMGWNSWNTFGESINEQLIREMADAIVSTGLKDAGYEYVVIDDCWAQRSRDKNGRLVEDFDKFPSGMKALADYIHSLGLKFGMYSCAGILTCAEYPGSFDKEFTDAQTFADYGVDFLKYDYCYFPKTANPKIHYNRMSMALKATGRDILFSACNWGEDNVEQWIRSCGAHMYRSSGDIGERFSAILHNCRSQEELLQYSAPGCYNDMDMLVCGMDGIGNVGHPGLCGDIEYKTHFALWCMSSAPLMIGADIRRLRPETLNLLKNPGLLRINSDSECRPPITASLKESMCPSYFKHLSDNQFAVAFFNLADDAGSSDMRPWDIGLPTTAGLGLLLEDVFTGEKIGPVNDYIKFELAPHDCRVFIGNYTEI